MSAPAMVVTSSPDDLPPPIEKIFLDLSVPGSASRRCSGWFRKNELDR
jgi:hypothetical protein